MNDKKNADKMERITAILPTELLDKLDNLKWDMRMSRLEFIRSAIAEKVEDLELQDKGIQKAYICKRCGYASPDKYKVEECVRSHPDEDTVKMHYEPHVSTPDTITVQRGDETLIFFFDNERTAEVNLHNGALATKSMALKGGTKPAYKKGTNMNTQDKRNFRYEIMNWYLTYMLKYYDGNKSTPVKYIDKGIELLQDYKKVRLEEEQANADFHLSVCKTLQQEIEGMLTRGI